MNTMKRILSAVLTVTAAMTLSACSAGTGAEGGAAGYPKQPINMIVPVAAGGSSDTMARAMSTVAEQYLGEPLIIENKEGAGGTVATTEFMADKPDGYNLMLAHAAIFTSQPKMQNVAYSADDFEGVIGLSVQPVVLVVGKDSPYQTFEDLADSGDEITFAGNSVGSIPHIGTMDLFSQAGVKATHIPFNGAAAGITAMLGGQVDAAACHPDEVVSYVDSGDVRILGVMTPERFASIPDVPTFQEMGYDVDYSVWKSILVPKGTDPEIKQYLYDAFSKLLEDLDVKTYFENAGIELQVMTGEEVDEKLRSEVDAYSEVIDSLGLV